jgi:NADPH:quinone reductase-like Zn-dependent oxidoreductase
MQALFFSQTGDLSALALVERPTPEPARGEVLVEIKAAGLNPSDVKNVLGFFPAYTSPPRIPGRDFAGVVRKGPPDWVGKRVFGTGLGLGFSQDGTHAQFLTLPAAGCAEIPEILSFAQAAACGVPYTAAWDGLRRAAVGPGKNLLVIGGHGAVGSAAIALGRALGANVVAAVRRPEQAAALQDLGYETLLLGAPESLSEKVLQKFGAGADAIYETTGAWLPAAIPAAAKHGAICVIAPPGMGKLHVDFPVLDFYRRGLTLLGVNSLLHDTPACAKMLAEFSGLFQSGALPPPKPREIALAEGLEAYRLVQEGFSGKIVLTPDRSG